MARKEEARRLPLKMTKSVSIWNFWSHLNMHIQIPFPNEWKLSHYPINTNFSAISASRWILIPKTRGWVPRTHIIPCRSKTASNIKIIMMAHPKIMIPRNSRSRPREIVLSRQDKFAFNQKNNKINFQMETLQGRNTSALHHTTHPCKP
jgi:hypothetical protein